MEALKNASLSQLKEKKWGKMLKMMTTFPLTVGSTKFYQLQPSAGYQTIAGDLGNP